MKYVIMCGGFYEHWKTPKHLQVINGERIVERTIRILKELGIEDVSISSNNPIFDELGVPRLEHENSYRYEDIKDKNDEKSGILKGYWLDAFYPNFPKDTKVTYLYGDVYYTEECLRTIVGYIEDKKNMFFSTGWEPLAYRVNDYTTFMNGVKEVKRLQDEGKVTRESGVAITWELYRYLNGININEHKFNTNTHIKILDGSRDVDWSSQAKVVEDRFRVISNVFYSPQLAIAGGIPSFYKYLFKLYKDKDIVLYYKSANIKQLKELRKYVKVVKYRPGMKIKCKKAFFSHKMDIIDEIEAEEYIKIIHANYEKVQEIPEIHPKITKYIAVSQYIKDEFYRQTGITAEVCYNPITLDLSSNRPLRLISPTRLTHEKGAARIEKLAKLLDENGIDYRWKIFTRNYKLVEEFIESSPKIIYCEPVVDIYDELQEADFLVQLSDDEAYCYSVIESLILGVPVIVTPCPVFKELGLSDKNSITLDFDFQELPENFKEHLQSLLSSTIKYTPPKDKWDELLEPSISSYEYDPDEPIETDNVWVKPCKNYYDTELKRHVKKTEQPFITTRKRGELLKSEGYGIIVVYKDPKKQEELLN